MNRGQSPPRPELIDVPGSRCPLWCLPLAFLGGYLAAGATAVGVIEWLFDRPR